MLPHSHWHWAWPPDSLWSVYGVTEQRRVHSGPSTSPGSTSLDSATGPVLCLQYVIGWINRCRLCSYRGLTKGLNNLRICTRRGSWNQFLPLRVVTWAPLMLWWKYTLSTTKMRYMSRLEPNSQLELTLLTYTAWNRADPAGPQVQRWRQ